MTPEQALAQLSALVPEDAAPGRHELGVPAAALDTCARGWRQSLDLGTRLRLADALWQQRFAEARIAAAKLLTQARLDDDTAVWERVRTWLPVINRRDLADAVAAVGERRLIALPDRMDEVERWIAAPRGFTRRAAFLMTQPWARMTHPKPADIVIRERALEWAMRLRADPSREVRHAVQTWLARLKRHDPERAAAFVRGKPGE
ncbi:DNA alkylation repair enzyme [Albidovulum inexpectatum]|uniref:DNA alkylation repair enzyme n=1 Tax=Albidovulum inexpectatum TaxID=196587 RepID=A0A2S5JK08_9RHOB|nr:DNA alkylation repair protein [Albidovulum inexpectatum]PPB81834.1 DNA alkylation repair enzyme [Albidovulum inexpectatum]